MICYTIIKTKPLDFCVSESRECIFQSWKTLYKMNNILADIINESGDFLAAFIILT